MAISILSSLLASIHELAELAPFHNPEFSPAAAARYPLMSEDATVMVTVEAAVLASTVQLLLVALGRTEGPLDSTTASVQLVMFIVIGALRVAVMVLTLLFITMTADVRKALIRGMVLLTAAVRPTAAPAAESMLIVFPAADQAKYVCRYFSVTFVSSSSTQIA